MRPACEHCRPVERRSHLPLHAEYCMQKCLQPFQAIGVRVGAASLHVAGPVFEFLTKIGVARFEAEPDESKLLNRSLIFFHEAKRRGLDVRALCVRGKYPHEFRLSRNGKRSYYEGTPLNLLGQDDRLDEKKLVKRLLGKHGFPVPEGQSFFRAKAAIAYGDSLGYPLVVKPNSGSLSQHATYPVRSNPELERAIRIAKIYQPEFVVERFVEGSLYRVSVLGKREVFACRKEPASVTGNGTSTIRELIEEKNAHPLRGGTYAMNTTLHVIPLDNMLERNLRDQGLTYLSVPAAGTRIPLQKKCVLSHGCDIVGCTDRMHPVNRALCLKVAQIFDAQIIGIDLICEDISLPYHRQSFGIIETNSLPYVDMHAMPSHGTPDPVAETAWDIVLERLDAGL